MKLAVPILASLAVHAALAGVLGTVEPKREDAKPSQMVEIEVVPVPPPPPPAVEPLDVQVLDEQTTRVITKSKRRASSNVAIATGRAAIETTGGTTPGGTGTEPAPSRSKYLSMRSGSRPDLSLPTGRFDDLDRAPAGTAPAAGPPSSGLLEDAAGGRKKSDQDVFVAKVDRDGSVRMRDKANVSAELSWNPAKLLSGRFDVTDYLMRKTKNDPYASRKLKFLDETRDERVEIGKAWRQQQLQQTAMIMRKNLERAWTASSDLAARKQALFELWDEIVEPLSRDDLADEVLVEAARSARKAVIGFIRAHLPQGSELAYSESELVAFNAKKQSSVKFSPYE
jgi:hypothetical protein